MPLMRIAGDPMPPALAIPPRESLDVPGCRGPTVILRVTQRGGRRATETPMRRSNLSLSLVLTRRVHETSGGLWAHGRRQPGHKQGHQRRELQLVFPSQPSTAHVDRSSTAFSCSAPTCFSRPERSWTPSARLRRHEGARGARGRGGGHGTSNLTVVLPVDARTGGGGTPRLPDCSARTGASREVEGRAIAVRHLRVLRRRPLSLTSLPERANGLRRGATSQGVCMPAGARRSSGPRRQPWARGGPLAGCQESVCRRRTGRSQSPA